MPSLTRSRRAAVVCAALSLAVALCITATAEAASSSRAANAPGCLRGHWVASTAESQRVLKLMVPGPYTFTAKLYMDFRGGTLAYGTPAFVIEAGGQRAKGDFVTLHGYTAVPGRITLAAGESTVGIMGQQLTSRVPGGPVPFECNANRLKYRVPGAGWITLGRARG